VRANNLGVVAAPTAAAAAGHVVLPAQQINVDQADMAATGMH
jgi:hypothetical protein